MKRSLKLSAAWTCGISLCLLAAGLGVSNAVHATATGLIGYWNFDETSGATAVDSSDNHNDGGYVGSGVTASTDVPPTSCYLNPRSISFDGSGGYVSIPDNASMDPASQISIAFWMKANTVSNGYQHIVFKQGPVVTSYGVWLENNHVYMEDNDNSIRSLLSNAALTAGVWHYVAVTYDGSTQKLYIDGALDNSQSLPGITLSYKNSPIKVGSGDYNNPFNGKVDDLRIYGRALTDQEVADIAGGGCGPGVISNNGLADGVEDAAPNGGDANDDGTADSQQANVASFVDAQTNHYVSVAVPSACSLSSLSTAADSAQAVFDTGYSYPAGLTNYVASCGTNGYTATVTLYYYGLQSSGLVLRKYNPTTNGYSMVSDATISQVVVGGQEATKVSYHVTDGGMLDTDGIADGTIVDPVGLASTAQLLVNTGIDLTSVEVLSVVFVVAATFVVSRQYFHDQG